MRVLAFDTSFDACSAAVAIDGRIAAARLEPMQRGHAERLIPMIGEVMAEAGAGFTDLDRIAVSVGPGTFTGVRVAVAAAEGLGLATGIALAGATSLAVMAAMPGLAGEEETIAVAVDAGRGECYAQLFAGLATRPLGAPRRLTAEEVARAAPAGRPLVAVGSAAPAVLDLVLQRGLAARPGPPCPYPDAVHLARLAPGLAEAARVAPLYLRAPDAKPAAAPHA